jgi:23S rRNA pseudouridine1911/1915/1917 synthase
LVVDAAGAGLRLDRWLAAALPDFSRSRLQALIDGGHVAVNGSPARTRQAARPGDRVEVRVPPARPAATTAEEIPLRILHEEDDLVVLDKDSGMVVHPAAGHAGGTLVNALLHRYGPLSTIGGVERPGIVHRLDKDTSGLLVVARNDAAHHHLAAQFAGREVFKLYLAVVHGRPREPTGRIRAAIGRHPVNRQKRAVLATGGKPAATDFQVLESFGGGPAAASLVLCRLHTGRTHQIRVHLQHLGHPILADPIYGNPKRPPPAPRLMLHAWHLALRHPRDGRPLAFTAAPPLDFAPWQPATGWPAAQMPPPEQTASGNE